MVADALFGVISFLLWPVLIITAIVMLRRRRQRLDEEQRQSLAELNDVLRDVRHRLRVAEQRLDRLEERGAALAEAPVAPPAVMVAE